MVFHLLGKFIFYKANLEAVGKSTNLLLLGSVRVHYKNMQ